jgi:hypothetical protein
MTAPHAEQMIEGYIARLRAAGAGLALSTLDELVEDMRNHISEARAREPVETDATILNILDRLGEPHVLVGEARPGQQSAGSSPAGPAAAYRPGVLEVVALVLLPFIWPIGVILLWISPAWNVRDKVIGTLLPPGGYPGLLVLGLAISTSGGSCMAAVDGGGSVVQTCYPGSPWWQVTLSVLLKVFVFALPLITTAYLAIRLRWGRAPRVAMS